MKSTKFVSKLFIILLLVFISCQKDDGISGGGEQQENIPDTFSEYFGNDISRDFLGTVIDKNNLPIEGVTISIGNETALTDSNGVFIIRDANVNERFGYVKAEKTGYIHGSRSVVPSNGTNKVTIMLLEATVVGSVNSGSSGTITINDGSSVSFDGNFIKEDASAYSGSVDVIMHHLDPADEDMSMQMPGMLYAENEDGAERMLQTLGMLAIELRGSGGEDLNLAAGSTSEIKIPVDASLMSIAPATIPLWYFDEANGYWKEEGEAILQGNMYVGNVSHFSFWNCDIPVEAISLCATVTSDDNNTFNNLRVTITSTTFGTTYGYTNNDGEVCGYVPNNEILTLNVYNHDDCDDLPLYTQIIGPFSSDSDLTVVISNNPDIIQETIVGNFLTCDGEPVSDGYVLLNYNDREFSDLVSDGSFEITFYRCSASSEFTLSGIDYENSQVSDELSYNFVSPITNIGDVTACINYGFNYLHFQVGDHEPNSWVETSNQEIPIEWEWENNLNNNNQLTISLIIDNQSEYFYFDVFNYDGTPGVYLDEDTTGGHPETFFRILSGGMVDYDGIDFTSFTNFNGATDIHTFGAVGTAVDISFSGTVDIQYYEYTIGEHIILEENLPINGYLHFIRMN